MRRPLRVGELARFAGMPSPPLYLVTKRKGSKVILRRLDNNERPFGCYRHEIRRVVLSFVGPVVADVR